MSALALKELKRGVFFFHNIQLFRERLSVKSARGNADRNCGANFTVSIFCPCIAVDNLPAYFPSPGK